ncbi:hypothetical protein Bca4012_052384 [Brassica carinata]
MVNQDEWLGTLRYAGKAQDKVSLDTLMLRYRPIAPKPTTGQPCDAGDNNKNSYNLSKRTKRKYIKVSKNNNTTCRGKTRSDLSDDREPTGVVTLQLMPEKSDLTSDCTPETAFLNENAVLFQNTTDVADPPPSLTLLRS